MPDDGGVARLLATALRDRYDGGMADKLPFQVFYANVLPGGSITFKTTILFRIHAIGVALAIDEPYLIEYNSQLYRVVSLTKLDFGVHEIIAQPWQSA
jgi:hypothetical protein